MQKYFDTVASLSTVFIPDTREMAISFCCFFSVSFILDWVSMTMYLRDVIAVKVITPDEEDIHG